MVAQAPVFIGIYQALRKLTDVPGDVAKELAAAAKGTGATVLDLAQQRGFVPRMPFLGLGDLAHPAKSSIAGILLIALMTLAQLVTTRQLNPGTTDQQRRLQMMMPFMFIFLFIGFPAGLVLYWATQSLYQLVQQLVMTRDMRKDSGGWRSLIPSLPGRSATKRPQRKEPKRAPVPVPASAAVSSTTAFEDAEARRILAEKRARRRRRKKKRRR
jgi:membrane protein insertase Oxa1/YidC/SpoIIIJ